MTDWIAAYIGPESAPAVSYGIMGLAALIGALLVLWLFRKFTRGTFVSGGRNNQRRISVQDAAPVDSHRRLVLVRRDDVEHLLLIGGNTDIVVEQGIRGPVAASLPPLANPPQRRERPAEPEAAAAYPAPPPRQPQPLQAPRPVVVQPPVQRQEPQAEPMRTPINPAPVHNPNDDSLGQRFAREPRPAEPLPAVPVAMPAQTRPAATQLDHNLDDELEKMLGDFESLVPGKQ